MRICFATHNKNKLKEIKQLLPAEIDLIGLDDLGLHEEIPETADTIEGNSQMKTRYVYDRYQIACFGDDTGLEVEALNGEPGVYSARYAGEEKSSLATMNLLLKKLLGTTNRAARFKTVITYIDGSGKEKQFTGTVEGDITTEMSGEGGFGYDPVFRPLGFDKTFAEMTSAEKNAISHRARAFQQLIDFLKG